MNSNDQISKKVIKGFFWRFFERCGAQGVTFIVSIILARILDPELYGTIALVTVFTAILQVFVDSGLGNALIQKKDADDLDFSSVFYFNVLMCIVLYIGMFLAAPHIASFYNDESLTPVIRVLSITIIISGVKNVQQAYVSRHMLFKRFFFSTLGGTLGAAIVGIVMAYNGFGVWALVCQNLFNLTIDTIILWITVKWRPQKLFSLDRLKKLFSFGWKLFCAALLENVYREFRSLIIGKMYSAADLAYYNRGQQFPSTIVTNINSSIDSVLFPALSNEQDDREVVKRMTRRAIKTSSFIMMPIMMGLAMIAEPMVRIVLTEKWLPCVPFLRIFCFIFAFYPIHTSNLNAIKACGRSDISLVLGIIKKAIGLTALLLTIKYGVLVMAYSLLFTTVIDQIVNAFPNRKLLNYSYLSQIKDILPSICYSIVMGLAVFMLSMLQLNEYLLLCVQILSGILVYFLCAFICKDDVLFYILDLMKSYKSKKK